MWRAYNRTSYCLNQVACSPGSPFVYVTVPRVKRTSFDGGPVSQHFAALYIQGHTCFFSGSWYFAIKAMCDVHLGTAGEARLLQPQSPEFLTTKI